MSKPASTVDDPAITREIGETVYGLMTELIRGLPRDMSLTSVATLATLNRLGPRRVTDLAASEGVTQPSMTALVAALERSGHVTRRSDPSDKRASLVSVTDLGRDYVEQRRRAGAETVVSVLEHLTDDERAALAAAMPAMSRLREVKTRLRAS